MLRIVVAGAALAAACGIAVSAPAQTTDPIPLYPVPSSRSAVHPRLVYPPLSGAAAASDINCEPPGLPPSGIGALPPSTHSCP